MSKTILIVDDSESVREIVSYTLKDAGYNVLEAKDGKDALRHFANPGVELVITDLNMPEMDGIALIKEIRSLETYKYVPILMLTTESQAAKKQDAKAAGATGWIVKPFVAQKLLDTVQKVIR